MKTRHSGIVGLSLEIVLLAAGALWCFAGATAAERESDAQGGLDPENLPPEMTLTLEQLLNDPEGAEPDVDAARCLGRAGGYSTEVLDNQHLLFRSTTGRRAWLNRMRSECIGLRKRMILVMEPSGSRLCQLDTVYGVQAAGGVGVQSARCRLGKFEPITREHADALVVTFEARGKALAESRRAERRATRAERKRKRRAAREAKKLARGAAR